MAYQAIVPPLRRSGLAPLLHGHGGEGADIGPDQLRGVVVMVVVRLAPDHRRSHHQDAEGVEDEAGQVRAAQKSAVHVVVVEDEFADDQEAGQQRQRQPQRPEQGLRERDHGSGQKRSRGEQIPPTADGRLRSVRARRLDQITACSHTFPSCVSPRTLPQRLTWCTTGDYTGPP